MTTEDVTTEDNLEQLKDFAGKIHKSNTMQTAVEIIRTVRPWKFSSENLRYWLFGAPIELPSFDADLEVWKSKYSPDNQQFSDETQKKEYNELHSKIIQFLDSQTKELQQEKKERQLIRAKIQAHDNLKKFVGMIDKNPQNKKETALQILGLQQGVQNTTSVTESLEQWEETYRTNEPNPFDQALHKNYSDLLVRVLNFLKDNLMQ